MKRHGGVTGISLTKHLGMLQNRKDSNNVCTILNACDVWVRGSGESWGNVTPSYALSAER